MVLFPNNLKIEVIIQEHTGDYSRNIYTIHSETRFIQKHWITDKKL